jgi:hypothetical protein
MRKHGILRPGPSPEGGRDCFWFCRILTRDPSFVRDDSGWVSSRGRFHGRGISLLVLSGQTRNPSSHPLRTTEQGPSRCSGRQSQIILCALCSGQQPTRGLRHYYVILRSGATKNLTLIFKTLNQVLPPGMLRDHYAQDNNQSEACAIIMSF